MSLRNSQVLDTPLVWVKADSTNVSSRSEMCVCVCVCVRKNLTGCGMCEDKERSREGERRFFSHVIKEYGGRRVHVYLHAFLI